MAFFVAAFIFARSLCWTTLHQWAVWVPSICSIDESLLRGRRKYNRGIQHSLYRETNVKFVVSGPENPLRHFLKKFLSQKRCPHTALIPVSLTSKKAQVSRKVKFERLGNGNYKLIDHWKLPTFSDLNSRASRNMPFFDVKDWMLVSYLGNSTATVPLCLELIYHAGQKSSSSMGTTELIIGQLFLPVCRL